mgnify:CR=1 FL=1
MFNLGAGEIAVILVVALLLLGPNKLPELARGIGKFMREFRRQTDDVRGMVEREFYKMDQDVFAEDQVKRIEPPKADATPAAAAGDAAALPPPSTPRCSRRRRASWPASRARGFTSPGDAGSSRRRRAASPRRAG